MNVGLVLGGGGAKGSYQVGVIRALEEAKIFPQIRFLSGTSIGSVHTFMLLNGNTSEQLTKLWESIDNKVVQDRIDKKELLAKKGLFSPEQLIEKITPYINENYFNTTKLTGYATLSKIHFSKGIKKIISKEVVVLNNEKQPLNFIVASSAIPLFFEPQIIEGETYVDGGLSDNLPLEPLINDVDIVISIGLNSHLVPTTPLKGKMLIDFTPLKSLGLFPFVTLNFAPSKTKTYAEQGYNDALLLIKHLQKVGLIDTQGTIKFIPNYLANLNDVIKEQ